MLDKILDVLLYRSLLIRRIAYRIFHIDVLLYQFSDPEGLYYDFPKTNFEDSSDTKCTECLINNVRAEQCFKK